MNYALHESMGEIMYFSNTHLHASMSNSVSSYHCYITLFQGQVAGRADRIQL